jgi:hypothetical protein
MADTLVERVTGQASPAAVPVEVQLVMPAESLFADGDEPGRVGADQVGGGMVVPDAFARSLIRTCADAGAKAWVRRLFATPDGADLAAMDSRRRAFEGTLRRLLVARDQTCSTPWRDAPIRHADHITPARARGHTSNGNGRGTCEACNYAKEAPGWTATTVHPGPSPGAPHAPPHTVRLTTPTGHSYDSTAPPVLPSRTRPPVQTQAPGYPADAAPEDAVPADPDPANYDEWLTRLIDAA